TSAPQRLARWGDQTAAGGVLGPAAHGSPSPAPPRAAQLCLLTAGGRSTHCFPTGHNPPLRVGYLAADANEPGRIEHPGSGFRRARRWASLARCSKRGPEGRIRLALHPHWGRPVKRWQGWAGCRRTQPALAQYLIKRTKECLDV